MEEKNIYLYSMGGWTFRAVQGKACNVQKGGGGPRGPKKNLLLVKSISLVF